ncbi:ATP-binding protein [Longispora albida]|uniref:ATP-binding protein n=1 Tax=Longispora albida TaxID=203523 RepID=UPI0004762962|nr:AAA family ATPase [Longispora albida]
MMYGRAAEQSAISALLESCRTGASGALLLSGDPGIGKSALLDHAAGLASGMRVLRGTGIESEAELPFAGLHLLLAPALDRLPALPGPQRQAIEAAFGLGSGGRSDRLLTGLAVLSLLGELAEDGPLFCVIDDAQWLDRASADALLFAARRLGAEGVAMLFAARPEFEAAGLPVLALDGLAPPDAAALLDSTADLAPAVRYQVLAEAQGNPLALLELPAAVADGGSLPLTSRLRMAFHGQASRLPAPVQALLLVAAAEDTGDLDVVLRAASTLGSGPAELAEAEEAGLVVVAGRTLRFRHPLIRAAVYQGAAVSRRLFVHGKLAEALGQPQDADRRAWHLARAATGTDEALAAELERTAERARERTGYAAAAAGYERAAQLSTDPAAAARRYLLAAEAATEAGDLDRALTLAAQVSTVDGRLRHVQGIAHFWQGSYGQAHRLLLEGADLSPEPASILEQAFHTAWYAGEAELAEIVDRLAALGPGYPVARLLATAMTGTAAEVSAAIDAARQVTEPRDLAQVCGIALVTGRDHVTYELATDLAARGRADGWIGFLPTVGFFLAEAELFAGRHRDAHATATDALRIAEDTGQAQWRSQLTSLLAYLAAVAGDAAECQRLVAASADLGHAGQPWCQWALALLDLGTGRAAQALARLETLGTYQISAIRSVPDLVEAAVRVGEPERAAPGLARFEAWAARAAQPWSDALVLRCRALLRGSGEDFTAALALGEHASRPFEQARTALLYGEYLRRARRKRDARRWLQPAVTTLEALGAEPWAARARAELTATGAAAPESARQGKLAVLTPQELQIVRLAATGLSNKDIAAQLFLSPRTVGHHLYKAYPKLGIISRAELACLPLETA